MTRQIKVSAVSYLNSAPFVYGLQQWVMQGEIDLSLDYPAECARKLLTGEVDVGLVPVAVIPEVSNYQILSDYCIGAEGPVRSVVLVSNSPIHSIEQIYLDYQSRTSVLLAKVLAQRLWKKQVNWLPLLPSHPINAFEETDGVVVIGDKVFDYENRFAYTYDLATEWRKLTSLPFVFAAWTANKVLPDTFTKGFNKALAQGLESIPLAVNFFAPKNISGFEAEKYLKENISYRLTDQKREALKLFWSFGREIKPG
ncbi:MAG: menaquinone biosynthesis protein [Tenuifilaceae bacterium]|nr:menaquinone biosynthesis protein [Tenuifilaceae bacterium]